MATVAGVRCAIIAVAVMFVPSIAAAQASLQVPLEFDFLNPGARSLAMGSAFVGLADDASAAFTNPAGLTILSRPEVSIEGRGRRVKSRFLERGRLSGTLTNRGIDTITGAQYGTNEDDNFTPAFVSFVAPFQNKFAVAFYRHELTRVDEQFDTQGVFQFDRGINADIRETALRASRELDIINYGFSVAARPVPSVSIGLGVSAFDFSLDSTFTRFVTFPSDQPATYDPARATFEGTQTGSDRGIGASVGVLWMPRRQFQAGAVFRKGPSFAFAQSLRDLPGGTPTTTTGTFRVPDAFALGGAWRPNDAATLAFEYTFVKYTSLENDYIEVQARPSGRQARFTIDNGNEIHVGFEYVFTSLSKPPALRAGYWYDPSHVVNYTPPANPDTTDERFAAYLPGEKALSHVTFGGGVSLARQFEVNAAADLSSRRSFFSIFAVVRF